MKAFFIADPGAAIPHILGTETLTICVRLTCPLAQPAVTDPRLAPLLRSQSGMDESVGQVGAVVEGDPRQIETVIDVWTFERDTRSRDPNWQLVETGAPA